MNKMAKLIVHCTKAVLRGTQKRQISWINLPNYLQDNWWDGEKIGSRLVWQEPRVYKNWDDFYEAFEPRSFLDRAYNFALSHSLQTGPKSATN